MDATPRWDLPMLFAGQAQKEIFHNEALARIDLLLHGVAESASVSVPPAHPGEGQCWILPMGASEAWVGQGGKIAWWTEGGWRFVAPQKGITLDVRDIGYRYFHDGETWREESQRADGLYIGGKRIVASRRPAIVAPTGGDVVDAQARTTIVLLLETLRSHGLIES